MLRPEHFMLRADTHSKVNLLAELGRAEQDGSLAQWTTLS